ncbi:MAG: hypothetical protein ACRDJ5_00455 [Actinomycetota bacterium]
MSTHPRSEGRNNRRPLKALVVVLLLGGLVTTAGVAQAATFTALEIFPPEGALRAGTPLRPCDNRRCKLRKYDSARFPAALPQRSLESRVVAGIITKIVRNDRRRPLQYRIGTGGRRQWVFASAATRRDNNPRRGSRVRVIATRRTLSRPRPLVAERITNTQPGERFPIDGAGAPDVERGFLWTGTVESAALDTWVISDNDEEHNFTVDNAEAPAEIEPGLGAGSRVTVQFVTGNPAG